MEGVSRAYNSGKEKNNYILETSMHSVFIDGYNLIWSNFYWTRRADYGLSEEELKNAGVENERVQIDESLVDSLKAADQELQKHGFRLYVKEGYRSPELYNLIYQKRTAKYGAENVNKILNMEDKPHATGKAVDIGLLDKETLVEVPTRKREDGPESLLCDFYRNKDDAESKLYQARQDLL